MRTPIPYLSVRHVRYEPRYLTKVLGTIGTTSKSYPGIGIPYLTYPTKCTGTWCSYLRHECHIRNTNSYTNIYTQKTLEENTARQLPISTRPFLATVITATAVVCTNGVLKCVMTNLARGLSCSFGLNALRRRFTSTIIL